MLKIGVSRVRRTNGIVFRLTVHTRFLNDKFDNCHYKQNFKLFVPLKINLMVLWEQVNIKTRHLFRSTRELRTQPSYPI